MFTSDSRAEHFLDSTGAKWKYANHLPFSQLSSSWLTENVGRSQVLVDDAIQEYGALMAKGSPAPAPILWFNPKTKTYDVLDGTQRLAAEERAQATHFSAYIVITDSEELVQLIRVFANYRLQGGYQESAEWTLARAIEMLVFTKQMSMEECASYGGWTTTQVRSKATALTYKAAIEGIGGPVELADTLLHVIARNAQLSDFTAAPAAVAKFLASTQQMKMSTEEAAPYVEKFFDVPRSKRNLYQQFDNKLAEFLKRDGIATRLADPTRTRYQSQSAEGRVLKSLRATLTVCTKARDSREPINEMAEYFQVVNQIKTTLQQIEKASKAGGKQVKKRGR